MVRTRIAPSPTGFPHIGTIYLALFNYVYAKQNQGAFIVRIEDTDRARFVEGAEKVIFESLRWVGLDPDEDPLKGGPFGPYRQSERLALYKKYAEKLVQQKHAYYCFCTRERLEEMREKQRRENKPPMYDRYCRALNEGEIKENLKKNIPYVIRMRVPEDETVTVNDLLLGSVQFSTKDIDDQILLKSDGYPTYHLAVVVDDHLMNITHVFRGREWLPSTPKHILLYRFFEWDLPVFGHLPLILNPDGRGKLSKRHGHASVDYYRKAGYLPEALLNYLSNLVWAHPEGKEIYSLREFTRAFSFSRFNSQGALFNLTKLDWMNGEYIRRSEKEKLKTQISAFFSGKYSERLIEKTIPIVQERIKTLSEYDKLCRFFIEVPKNYELDLKKYKDLFKKIIDELNIITTWKAHEIGRTLQTIALKNNMKNSEFFMAVRVAITGKKVTPPLNESMEILGKKECIERIERLIH